MLPRRHRERHDLLEKLLAVAPVQARVPLWLMGLTNAVFGMYGYRRSIFPSATCLSSTARATPGMASAGATPRTRQSA